MTEMDLKDRDRLQSSQVNLLASRCIGVPRSAVNNRREILYSRDLMTRQEGLTKFGDIKPLEWCSANSTVIQIEPVNVEKGLRHKKLKPTRGPASRPTPEGIGVISRRHATACIFVCQQEQALHYERFQEEGYQLVLLDLAPALSAHPQVKVEN